MAAAEGMKSEADASMRLAARAKRGARSARRWAALPRLAVLKRAAELTVRTKSILTGAGSATPRCCIAARRFSLGLSVWSALAQAVRHLYRSASTGWTEGVFAKKRARSATEMLSRLLCGENADWRDEARSGIDGLRT